MEPDESRKWACTFAASTGADHVELHVAVDASGRIRIPAAVRKRFGIKPGDKLAIIPTDEWIQVETLDQSLKAAQEYFRSLAPADASLVDALIQERREEVEREERESPEDSRIGHTAALPPTVE